MKHDNKNHLPLTFRKSAAYLFAAVLTAGFLLTGCGSHPNMEDIANLPQSVSRQIQENLAFLSAEKDDKSTSYQTEEALAYEKQFDELTDQIFRETVTNSLLDLHYTVTNPEKLNLEPPESLYGIVSLAALQEKTASVKEMLNTLQSIPKNSLSQDRQLNYDILQSYLETECMAEGLEQYVRPFAPTIGIQAQLPVLLAEYAFYTPQDIEDYFSLLSGLDSYFGQLLAFQQEQADLGLAASDDAIDRILESCSPYLETGENCILASTFSEKLDGLDSLSEEKKASYISRHNQLVSEAFVPAYENLIKGLEQLKGTGKIEGGLCYYPKGKDYYRYLVYSSTSTSCSSIDTLEKTIEKQIKDDVTAIAKLFQSDPNLFDQLDQASFALTDPIEILSYLQEAICKEYPEPICKDYSLHYVPKALEPVLSPAFYLTPPMDRPGINPIYINQGSTAGTEQLFSTLAHEGYPGHLYQSAYFVEQNPAPFRHVLSFSSYTEGWATYVEHESYHMDPNMSSSMAELLAADSSINLGIHAYIDIMVNYEGWKIPEISRYVDQYYDDPNQQLATALYQAMVDNPTNYLEYYVGYLEFSDMRKKAEQALKKDFQIKDFHQFLLDIGPAPFPVIRKRLEGWIQEQKQ
ncbi:MAG: DUF885 domain-containing protein [Lachnospiraceae bacterium]|nr:DUF885 domain-containing protein [Lachnospiraceae bacterium]